MFYCAFNKEEIKFTKTNKTKELWGEYLNIVRVEIRFFFPPMVICLEIVLLVLFSYLVFFLL